MAAMGSTVAGLTLALASTAVVQMWAYQHDEWRLLCANTLASEDEGEAILSMDLGRGGLAVCGTFSGAAASLVPCEGRVLPLATATAAHQDTIQHVLALDLTHLVTARFSAESARLDLIKWTVTSTWSAVQGRESFYCFDTTRPLVCLRTVAASTWLVGLTQHRILLWDHAAPMLLCCIPLASGPVISCCLAMRLSSDLHLTVFSTDLVDSTLRTLTVRNVCDTDQATHVVLEGSMRQSVSAAAVSAGPFVVVQSGSQVSLLSLPDLSFCGSLRFEHDCRGVGGSDRNLVVLGPATARVFAFDLA